MSNLEQARHEHDFCILPDWTAFNVGKPGERSAENEEISLGACSGIAARPANFRIYDDNRPQCILLPI